MGIHYCTYHRDFDVRSLRRHVQYEVKRDFIPLGLIWQSPLVLVVNPKRGLKSVTDFVAYAKANSGKLSVASAGLGINTHMASELLKREAGSTSFTLLIAAPARRCRICLWSSRCDDF